MTNILILWCAFSILVFIIWGICINDPGRSEIGDTILTVICALLALPLTIVMLIIFLIFNTFINRDS